jgi:hypothetical protein
LISVPGVGLEARLEDTRFTSDEGQFPTIDFGTNGAF